MDRLFSCHPEKGEGEGYLTTIRDDPSIIYPVKSEEDRESLHHQTLLVLTLINILL